MSPEPRPEVLALLADIKDNPFDDGLRLILADWLDDNGSGLDPARAELIRSQVEYARLPAQDPNRQAFGRRARYLQQKHGREWLGPLERWQTDWACQRGLLSLVIPLPSFRSQGLLALAGTETWAWVEEVFFRAVVDEEVARLAGCPLLASLAAVGFRLGQLGPVGAAALARQPWLARLARLDLQLQDLTDSGLGALLASPHLSRLRALDLASNGLRAEAGRFLAGCPAPLRHLVLWGNRLQDQGVVSLCRGPGLRQLSSLNLRGNEVGDAGAAALAGALPGLRELDLADNHIGPPGAEALAASTTLGSLSSLILWGNRIGEPAARLLQQRFGSRVHITPLSL